MRNYINQFRSDGIAVLPNEDSASFKVLKESICSALSVDNLEMLHHACDRQGINALRLATYRDINSLDDWENLYYSMANSTLIQLLGPDLLIQRKLNLSIQMPEDETSVLGLHMDTLSGQSPFELVMWVPFTGVSQSNGMYYFDRKTSFEIRQEMPTCEDRGLEYLRQKYWNRRKELEVNEGDVVIFSGTLFHGNVVNKTSTTRISVNCRFKNLFSPDAPGLESAERGSGIFYKLLATGAVTDIGMEYVKHRDCFE